MVHTSVNCCARRAPSLYSRQHVWNFLGITCCSTSWRQRRQWFAVFDALLSAHCHWRVCVASVVSAAYDVHGIDTMETSLKEMADWREQVARVFGKPTERLCWYLHRLNKLDSSEQLALLERQLDAEHSPLLKGAKAQDIRDLQLVQVARRVALGDGLTSFPVLSRVWHEQQQMAQMCAALDAKSSFAAKLSMLLWRLRRFLPVQRGKFGIRLHCFGKERFVRLPVDARKFHAECVAELSHPGHAHANMSGFVLDGQGSFGMPATPFHMLNKYWDRRCAGFDFECKRLVPLQIQVVPLSGLPQPPLFDAVSASALAIGCCTTRTKLAHTLESQGWAAISVGSQAVNAIKSAYGAVESILQNLTIQEKDACQLKFDDRRFVGLAQDRGREWMQTRQGMDDARKFPWPEKVEEHRKVFVAAYQEAEIVALSIFEGLTSHYNLQVTDCRRLITDAESTFGPSVMRVFLYRDPPKHEEEREKTNASEYHADMGLVTVAPPSTIPALELFNPVTGTMTKPEDFLKPGEWLAFAGETLAFLSGGKVPAPVHRVPWVDRSDGKPRFSAPFFLRAAPEAELHPLCSGQCLTCRGLMERYNGLRPWRLGGVGDW